MFLKIARGGVGFVELKATSEDAVSIDVEVIDQFGLNSTNCHVSNPIEVIKPRTPLLLEIRCERSEDRQMQFLHLNYASFGVRELRGVVLH